uniref:[histone H3]-lysine(4) N-methyltransferase n=1 Tax=Denticeps clupeoides TaxID=299321 RepID=A0AAY4BUF4_9TELE
MTKLKRLREVKLSPLKSRFKAITRKGVPVPGVPRRRRGRPPSAERLKADAAAAAAALAGASTLADSSFVDSGTMKQKAFRVCGRDQDLGLHSKLRASHHSNARSSPSDPHSSLLSPQPASPSSKLGRPLGLRQSPRNSKPVRIVPTSKRTDATIAKQLLQRAKKGAQKKKLLEKESGGSQSQTGSETGIRRRRRTQLKNIRQFIMPVVSTVSLRIIKTPKRFIEDEAGFGTPPTHMKIPRLEATPTATAAVAAVTSPATQPSSSAPPLFTAASSSPSTAAAATVVSTAGSGAAADSLPPPPTPAPTAPSIPAPVVLASAPTGGSCNNSTSNGRLSSSAASCGSSAVSQHSSQLSSGESSRSSTPSLDDSSCDSQASEGTQALSEEPDRSPSSQCEREDPDLLRAPPPPSPLSEPEHMTLLERGHHGRRCLGVRRGPGVVGRGRAGLISHRKKAIISPATGVLMSTSSQTASQQISSTASSSSSPPPPPLLSQPQAPQSSSSSGGEHHAHSPWLMSHSIPPPFIPGPSVLSSHHDKRRSILREPTFRWTSFSSSEQHYFSSAKYAKEGLIRKPIFDNFRPPPLTAEDVGLMPSGPGPGGVPQAGFPAAGAGAGGAGASTRLFSPVHHQQHSSSSRFELSHQKRSPLLRAPRFTPSEAHSRIFESVTLPSSSGSSPGSLSPLQGSSPSSRTLRRRRRRVFGPLRGQPRSDSSETSVRGPRIKHVCRRAAVALGRHRAVFPDDMPTLSALPWEEREKILSSMGNDDKSSVAGSEEAEPPTPPLKPVTRHKAIQEAQPKKGRRSRRCGQCPGCQVPEDCGVCTNCLDKPKFGGRNIKKQCCKKDKRRNKCEKKDSSEGSPKQPHSSVKDDPPRRRNETPLPDTPSARAPSTQQQKGPRDGVHRLRVDFREDHALERVWEMGGLSVLSSVPVTPRVLCFLCASSGNVEFVFCQVCCEPFHLFCLGETERPLEEHLESWCCRRCRFCHACGRQHQNTKQLLECDKCRNSYHPECLGPNHPTRPTKKKRICTKCVCCKSCGATKPGNTWDAQWSHDFSLCHDCAKLLAKGNFCPLCDKCYDDEECDSKIMQCGRCDRWVHAKCEGLTDEMYEILSKLPENTIYTCISCTERPPAEWRTVLERKMQSSIRQVLTALLNSHTSTHLLRYRQVTPSSDSPADLESIEKKMDLGRYRSVVRLVLKVIWASEGGRLLYIGQNEWTHVNCALWSAEVFEDDDGSLKNVHMAVIRGRQLRCENCQKPGATVACCLTSCTTTYHFMCARQRDCVFLEDKKVYCQRHRDLIKGEVLSDSGFEVTRRVLVDFEGISLRRTFSNGLEPHNVHLMIGSMTIDCLGMLTELSDCERKLFPIGYQCSRVYWSTLDARKRCVYTCRILVCHAPVVEPEANSTVPLEENFTITHSPTTASGLSFLTSYSGLCPHLFLQPPPMPLAESPGQSEVKGSGALRSTTPDQERSRNGCFVDHKPKKGLIFEISSDDGFQIRCESIEEAWKSLTDKVQEARSNARLKELSLYVYSVSGVNGLRMLGVLHDAVVFLLEQLYGARYCQNYRFRFHKPDEPDEPPVNPHGSARAELHHRRSVFDIFNFLASKHRQPPEYSPQEVDEEDLQLKSARRSASLDLPMVARFRHLKKISKEAVGVYRSPIHGRGLFCKRNIEAGEMIIEYSGNVIRSVLSDKREKYYDSKGVGCYMFRISEYEVVDATMHGNAARFINHSCEPNCYSRVIAVDGQKHIVIFAMRKIYRGEELTYDYKFPIEETGNKLPCNCGAKTCRRFLN